MADSTSKGTIVLDSLSKDERFLCIASMQLKHAAVERAIRAETNDAIKSIREAELANLSNLIRKFSFIGA